MMTVGAPHFTLKERKYIQFDLTENNSLSCEFTFSATVHTLFPIYLPQNQITGDPKQIEKSVLDLIQSAISLGTNDRISDFVSLTIDGMLMWMPYAEPNYSSEWKRNYSDNTSSLHEEGYLQFQTYEPTKYSIKIGTSLILVYRPDGENIFFKSEYNHSPVLIACINGKYVFWRCAPTG